MTHRASYWKTTAISFVTAALCLLFLVWVNFLHLQPFPASLIGILFAAGLAAGLLVTTGGLVCLWRDARETSGKKDPLLHYALWEPKTGFLTRIGLRFLQGSRLRPGDLVQVRSRHEIVATLDDRQTLSELPFMPEMEFFCGSVFRVHRRVDHINDMRNKTGLRRLCDVVTLSKVRCSGLAHDGCQAECQILWKERWLKRVPDTLANDSLGIERRDLESADHGNVNQNSDGTYFCQMTALWEASRPMTSFDVRQDLGPLLAGNIPVAGFLVAFLTHIFNVAQRLRGGSGYPYMPQYSGKRDASFAGTQFSAGDAVTVRSKDEISRTLVDGKNKGLWFDRDMIRFCGRTAVVRKPVNRIIHESTARMVVFKTPCVMLEDVIATGEFLRLCPQHEYIFWREPWLSRSRQDQPSSLASGR